MGSILVIAEIQKGKIREASYELVAFARKIGGATNREVKSLVMGQGISASAEELAKKGGGEVFAADDAALANYSLDAAFAAVTGSDRGGLAGRDPALEHADGLGPRAAHRGVDGRRARLGLLQRRSRGQRSRLLPPLLQRQVRLATAPDGAAAGRDDAARCDGGLRGRGRRQGDGALRLGRRDRHEVRRDQGGGRQGRRSDQGRHHRVGRPIARRPGEVPGGDQAARRRARRRDGRLAAGGGCRLAAARVPGRIVGPGRVARSSTSPAASRARSSTWSA